MNRRLLLSALVVLLSACGGGFGSSASKESIRIGAIYSLSGDQAALDESSLRGAELAVSEINQRGGVLGTPLVLEVRDAKTSKADSARQASELFEEEALPIVIGLSDTDLAEPVASTSQAVGAIFVTSGATGPVLVQEAPTTTFLACFSDDAQAKAAAMYGARQLQLRRVSLLFDAGSEYARVLSRAFGREFRRLGGSIAAESSFQVPNLNADAVVQHALQSRPEGVFLAAQPEEAGAMVSALRSSGFAGPILGGDSYDSPLVAGLPDDKKQGVYYTTHALLVGEAQTPEMASFIDGFTEQYGAPPVSAFAALGYDTVNLVAAAIEQAGSTQPADVLKALESIREFRAVTGSISYGLAQHIPTKDVTVVTFVGSTRVRAAIIRQ